MSRSGSDPTSRIPYSVAGWVFVALATAGLALPLLPATPFLLLAAWCFARSSPRFHDWLIRHRIFGELIAAYRERKGMTVLNKVVTLLTLWFTMAVSAYLVPIVWVHLTLATIGIGVTIHIVRMRTRSADDGAAPATQGAGESD